MSRTVCFTMLVAAEDPVTAEEAANCTLDQFPAMNNCTTLLMALSGIIGYYAVLVMVEWP
jgi:hypothetical protein